MTDEREIVWPPPRPDPEEERSHPGARLDDLSWWKRWWIKWLR